MTHLQVVKAFAKKIDRTQTEAKALIEALREVYLENLTDNSSGSKIKLLNLVNISKRTVKERVYKVPNNKQFKRYEGIKYRVSALKPIKDLSTTRVEEVTEPVAVAPVKSSSRAKKAI